MFEAAELGNRVSREEYAERAPALRADLLRVQSDLGDADFPVIIVIGGMEGAGKSETVNFLLEWLDARGVMTHAFGPPSDEEQERPRFWRYWMALPPTGRIGILFGSWYTDPIVDRTFRRIGWAKLDQELDRINEFERMLVREGALILKVWLHLSKKAQKSRLKELEENPDTHWRVTKTEWKFYRKYDRLRTASEHALRKTNTGEAPWHVVEGTDERYRHLAVAELIVRTVDARLRQAAAAKPPPPRRPSLPAPKPVNVLNQLDLSLSLKNGRYDRDLAAGQGRLNLLTRRLKERGRSMTLVFEGPDAAGKGGAIRRLTAAIDARIYRVISVSAPTQEELAQHYLWRFWRHLPRRGRVTIYDRSWYGRVLVERLEGFCSEEAWRRAYEEINGFEEQLVRSGTVLLKFWLHVSAEEQLKRFEQREKIPYKQFKITEEDWRNREKLSAYEAAACDMIEQTSTEFAPWTLVEGDDKKWARIKVLEATCDRLEEALGGD